MPTSQNQPSRCSRQLQYLTLACRCCSAYLYVSSILLQTSKAVTATVMSHEMDAKRHYERKGGGDGVFRDGNLCLVVMLAAVIFHGSPSTCNQLPPQPASSQRHAFVLLVGGYAGVRGHQRHKKSVMCSCTLPGCAYCFVQLCPGSTRIRHPVARLSGSRCTASLRVA